MEDENLATIPYRKIHVKIDIRYIIHLPGKQRIITYSSDGSFRVWDLERGTQFGEEWEDKKIGVHAIALSPDGKTIASGSSDGVVKLRNVDTGKVIKILTGHTNRICSVCWSSGGGRVVSGSWDETFRVWNVESGQTILGPIKAMDGGMNAVCYSPDANMIATGGYTMLKIWDANTGELLKTLNAEVNVTCLAWTSDGKTLITGGMFNIMKFDTATWTPVVGMWKRFINTISLSPNEHILACASGAPLDKKVPLLNLETNQPIGTLVHNEDAVNSATFSADGKFLITSCSDGHIYTWDLSAIVKNATPRPVSKINGAHRIPTGFFDDALRDTNVRDLHP
jgi:WD40 repeat protein